MSSAVIAGAKAIWRTLSRGLIQAVAVVAMLVIYGVSSIGTTSLGVLGVTSLAMTTASAPAQAYRRRRRFRRHHRRRRRRRHRGVYLYF